MNIGRAARRPSAPLSPPPPVFAVNSYPYKLANEATLPDWLEAWAKSQPALLEKAAQN